MAKDPAKQAALADRKWFNEHPWRRVYVREYIPGEMGKRIKEAHALGTMKNLGAAPGYRAVTMVYQMAPGVRSRHIVYVPLIETDLSVANEQELLNLRAEIFRKSNPVPDIRHWA